MQHTANSFPDRRVSGDSRLLASIAKRSPSIVGGGSSQLPGGIAMTPSRAAGRGSPPPQGPFYLSVDEVDGVWKWKVASEYSTITDGTNGDAIDLSTAGFDGDGTTITETKYIVLEADVAEETLEITDWIFSAVDEADAIEEVRVTEEVPIYQDKIRLLIGKINFTDDDPPVVTAIQSTTAAQILVDALTNGLPSKVFANHSIHPTAL